MYESDAQKRVSIPIIDGEVDSVNVGVTDDKLAVVVDTGEVNAAYTADEVRELAKAIKSTSDQHWDSDNDELVAYIRDLADVVDGQLTEAQFKETWSEMEFEGEL